METPPSAEALLAEAPWVRALVRSLIADPERGEDVLQDTWLAALERPPRRGGAPGGARGLRAWLGAVARNLARARRRRELLRPDVERAAARPEVFDGEDERERLRLQQLLTEAVLALEEPTRSAIVLRYFDGLTSAEIAARQGCTNAAARQRVSRGLAELRQRLERRLGRGAWAAALARFVPATAARGVPLVVQASLGLAGVGAVALFVLASWQEPGPAPSELAPELASASGVAVPSSVPTPAAPRGSGEREPAGSAVDAQERASTDAAGAAPSIEPPQELAHLMGGVRGPQGELLDLTGTVSATVQTEGGERTVTSGFALESGFMLFVPAGRLVRVVASAPGYLPAVSEPGLALDPGGSYACNLALGGPELGHTLEGVLLDARTEAPIAGAWVSCRGSTRLQAANPTDSAGRFRITGVERPIVQGAIVDGSIVKSSTEEGANAPMEARLRVAELPGYASLRPADVRVESAGGVERFELRLEPTTCTLGGVVREPDGTPARFAWIRGLDATGRLAFAQADAHGRYALARPLPAGPLRLRARSFDDTRATAAVEEELELEPFEQRTADLQLAPADTRVELRVLDAHGAGVAGIEVHCRSAFARGVHETCPEDTTATSDDEGRVRFENLPPGDYEIAPRARELGAHPLQRELRLERGQTLRLGDFLVGRGFTLEGRVEASAPLAAFRVVARDLVIASERAAVPGADGRFAFDNLVEAAYELVLLRDGSPCARLTVGPAEARGIVLVAP